MLTDFGITREQLHDYMLSHSGQFKYLRILGITSDMVRLPKLEAENLVREVDPSYVPRRDYKPYKFDLERLIREASIRTNYFNQFVSDELEGDLDDMAKDNVPESD